MDIKSYLSTVLDAFTRFPDVQFIHVTPNASSITAGAGNAAKSVLLQLVGAPLTDVPAPACFGNLPYLKKLLSTFKDGTTAAPSVGKSMTGEDIIQYIDFTGPRMSVRYETTDPKAAPAVPFIKTAQNWCDPIDLEPTHYKDFAEAVSLLKLMNPGKSEFKISSDGKDLRFTFETGERASDRDIVLALTKTASTFKDQYANIQMLSAALSLMHESGKGNVSISDQLSKVEANYYGQELSVVIPKVNTAGR